MLSGRNSLSKVIHQKNDQKKSCHLFTIAYFTNRDCFWAYRPDRIFIMGFIVPLTLLTDVTH